MIERWPIPAAVDHQRAPLACACVVRDRSAVVDRDVRESACERSRGRREAKVETPKRLPGKSTVEAARHLAVSRQTIRRRALSGKLAHVIVNGVIRITDQSVVGSRED